MEAYIYVQSEQQTHIAVDNGYQLPRSDPTKDDVITEQIQYNIERPTSSGTRLVNETFLQKYRNTEIDVEKLHLHSMITATLACQSRSSVLVI